jgi:hypothetical protein
MGCFHFRVCFFGSFLQKRTINKTTSILTPIISPGYYLTFLEIYITLLSIIEFRLPLPVIQPNNITARLPNSITPKKKNQCLHKDKNARFTLKTAVAKSKK